MMLNCIVAVSVFVCVGALNIKIIKNVRQMDEKLMLETHQVTTSDLYMLTVFRLRNLKMNVPRNQHPVLLFHGLMESSDRFIEHGRNLSLAYDLVDAGFDVWLGNNRGNKYSRHHVYLNPDDPEDKFRFFNYTYEDIGLNDVSAIVDYILNETKTKQLHYIGHSQGGTIFFALNSLRPEYNEKFLTANLLAGAGYQKYFSNSFMQILASLADKIYAFLLKAGYVEVFPPKSIFQLSSSNTIEDLVKSCLSSIQCQNLCVLLHSNKMLGVHGLNSTWFAGGGAAKQVVHFGQNVREKRFCRWDYGKQNKQVYGTEYPPNYDLGLVTVNTTLHFGMNDTLVNYKDVADMANDMPNVRTRKVARDDFGHSDFTDAFDAKELVYDYIIESLLYFERNIKPDIFKKNSPVNLSLLTASISFINNNSNSFASLKPDSPITLISSFTNRSLNPANGEISVSRANVRNASNLKSSNLLPRNASISTNTVVFDLLSTNISKSSPSNFLSSLTTKIPNSSHQNDAGSITSSVLNSLYANNLDSVTLNGPNLSQIILKNDLATNKSDKLEENSLNNVPTRNFRRKLTDDNFTLSSVEYLPVTVSATSTKSYINTTLLITANYESADYESSLKIL